MKHNGYSVGIRLTPLSGRCADCLTVSEGVYFTVLSPGQSLKSIFTEPSALTVLKPYDRGMGKQT